MLNFLLFLFLFLFGCLVGGVLAFLFFIKKKITLNRDKIEKELVEYKNEFNNKYVDDGYDAY